MPAPLPPIPVKEYEDHLEHEFTQRSTAQEADIRALGALERDGEQHRRAQEAAFAERSARDEAQIAALAQAEQADAARPEEEWRAKMARQEAELAAFAQQEQQGTGAAPGRPGPPGGIPPPSAASPSPRSHSPGVEAHRAAVEAAFGDRGPAVVENMLAVMERESGGRPAAHKNDAIEDSRGPFQINARAHPQLAAKYDLFDPAQNARAAREVYDSQGYKAWLNASRQLGLVDDNGALTRQDARGVGGPGQTAQSMPMDPPPTPGQDSGLVSAAREDIRSRADSYLGTPYLWGGADKQGIDCSAFISRAWNVGRQTTDTLAQVAEPIAKDALQPGDALNLTTQQDPRGYGHVRMFDGWADRDHTQMYVYESSTATGGVARRVIPYDAAYTPMRLKGLSDDASPRVARNRMHASAPPAEAEQEEPGRPEYQPIASLAGVDDTGDRPPSEFEPPSRFAGQGRSVGGSFADEQDAVPPARSFARDPFGAAADWIGDTLSGAVMGANADRREMMATARQALPGDRLAAPGAAERAMEASETYTVGATEPLKVVGAPAAAAAPGVVGAVKRFFHGTGSAFDKPTAEKFDPSGLYGPGYYLTDSPAVADSYAAVRNETKSAAEASLASLRNQLASADPGLATSLERDIARIESALGQMPAGGPNVRAVDIPEGLNLLDVDVPDSGLAGIVEKRFSEVGRMYPSPTVTRILASQGKTPPPLREVPADNLLDMLNQTFGSNQAERNKWLVAQGYDGVRYAGGKRIPLIDDAGQPIEHTAVAIFPESLPKIRNAISGTEGGNIDPRLAARLGGATAGGAYGYAQQEPQQPGESDAAYAARVAASVGVSAIGGAGLAEFATNPALRRRLGSVASERLGIGPASPYEPDPSDFAAYMQHRKDVKRGASGAPAPGRKQSIGKRAEEEYYRARDAEFGLSDVDAARARARSPGAFDETTDLTDEDLAVFGSAPEMQAAVDRALEVGRGNGPRFLGTRTPEPGAVAVPSRLQPGIPGLTAGVPTRATKTDLRGVTSAEGGPGPSLYDRFQTVRFASMLSSTATQVLNNTANAANVTGEIPLKVLQVGADAVVSKLTGTERTRYLAEVLPQARGAVTGFIAGAKKIPGIMAEGVDAQTVEAMNVPRKGLQSGSKTVDAIVESPLRALSAADAMWRGAATGGHAAALATRQAIKEGLSGPARDARVDHILSRLEEFPAIATEAERLGARAVFQEHRTQLDPIVNLAKGTYGKYVGDVVLPFVRTPGNVAAQGIGMTPAGFFGALEAAKTGQRGEAIDRAVRAAVGTSAMGLGFAMASSGFVTGAYPKSAGDRSTLPEGWKPYSLRVPTRDGAVYVPLQMFGPVAMPLGIAAAIQDLSAERQGGADAKKLAMRSVTTLGKYVGDQAFLQGLAAIPNIIDEPERYLDHLLAGYGSSLMPASGLQKQVDQFMGRAQRDPSGAIEGFLAASPLTSPAVQSRLTPLGGEKAIGPSGSAAFVTGTRVSVERDEPALASLRAAGVGIPAPPKNIDKVALSEDEQRAFASVAGEIIRASVAALDANPRVRELPTEIRARIYQGAVDGARDQARGRIIKEMGTAEVRRRVATAGGTR